MSEAKVTAGRLTIHWDKGRYFVDVPNYDGGTVVPAEIADALLTALIDARDQLGGYEMAANGEYYNDLKINTAIAKATGAA